MLGVWGFDTKCPTAICCPSSVTLIKTLAKLMLQRDAWPSSRTRLHFHAITKRPRTACATPSTCSTAPWRARCERCPETTSGWTKWSTNSKYVHGAMHMTGSTQRAGVICFRLKTTTRAWWPRRGLWRETMETLSSLERSCPSPPKKDSTLGFNLAGYLPKYDYIIYIFLKSRNAPPETLFDIGRKVPTWVHLYFVALLCSLCTMYYEKL